MKWILALAVMTLVAASCGRGYESKNRSIVAELPPVADVVLLEENHYGYCSGDTCMFGDDRSGALLQYSVDTDRYSQDELVAAYRSGLPDWEASIEDGCANADPSFCDEIIFASFARGNERIDLNLNSWPAGRFDLHVDAEGGS